MAASVAVDLIGADFSLSGEQGGDGDGGFRRGGGGGGSVGAKGGGGGGAGGAGVMTRALSDLDLTDRRPDSPGLEKAGGEAGAGDSVAPGDDGYDGVLSVDAPGERARASTAACTAAASVRCELDVLDEPRGE